MRIIILSILFSAITLVTPLPMPGAAESKLPGPWTDYHTTAKKIDETRREMNKIVEEVDQLREYESLYPKKPFAAENVMTQEQISQALKECFQKGKSFSK